jgi:ribosomal protein L4
MDDQDMRNMLKNAGVSSTSEMLLVLLEEHSEQGRLECNNIAWPLVFGHECEHKHGYFWNTSLPLPVTDLALPC